MRRDDLVDLNAFLTVAEERSFTRAAARLGTSQSSLSHTIRRLEARLDVRLLTRTTRSVMPTQAGERLIATLRPAFADIAGELANLTELARKPSGTIRITASPGPARTILWPVLERFLPDYPDVHVEISADIGLVDIVADRFDAGVRFGDQVAKDMIAVRIGPDVSMAAVASPAYIARHSRPRTPYELSDHNCINLRLRTAGGLYAWEFGQAGREFRVRVAGQLTFNHEEQILTAARAGFGIAYLPEDHMAPDLASGTLIRMLEDWSPPFSGYHLYYPSRRQLTPAFALLVEALRWRG
ncbi:LysR family transcriptional regulator [Sphingomonas crocodyli]|uniref:LysR family transcriptional regulator n=1 Tax=Sphingomonas crocodyli TaxID=1979270 RepID=A0A437M5L0_9SPHN|nr:LysR family transcriptional regulator [Sphingomonas crocodyli]RVT92764.1 LysR family transcriptional regulator [Sphingomonas crocodyli]